MTYDRVRLAAEIGRDEGDKLKWYRCTAGKRSIGKGRNLDDVGISKEETRLLGITVPSCIARGINQAQSDALFANDIGRSERDLDAKLPWWRKLDGVRQRVLLNMCFNMGMRVVQQVATRASVAVVGAAWAATFERSEHQLVSDTSPVWDTFLQTEDGEPIGAGNGTFLDHTP